MTSEEKKFIKKAKESLLASEILAENKLYNFYITLQLPELTIPCFILPKPFCGSKV
jgi:hypothetical protein